MSIGAVLALDVGTSSVRAQLLDTRGEPLGRAFSRDQMVHTDRDGTAEIDADVMVDKVILCAEDALAADVPLVAVGLSTFWHSCVGVGADGRAVTPLLTWADTRPVEQVRRLRRELDVEAVHQRTGCLLHTSYWPARLRWVAENRPEWQQAVHQWLSPGEYLMRTLCGESICSLSMASATGLFDQRTRQWDVELMQVAGVRIEQLPPVPERPACPVLTASWAQRLPRLRGVPWTPPLGDGACSNVGCGAVQSGDLAIMLGTSGALRVLAPYPQSDFDVPSGLWRYALDQDYVLYGGALSNGGSVWAWLQNTLRVAGEAPDPDSAPDGHGLTILPFLAGERSPGWRGDARATIHGLSWNTRPQDILQAGMESVTYRLALVRDLLRPRTPHPATVIATGGALLRSPVWLQMLADVLGEPVVASQVAEASSRGCALMAVQAVGGPAFGTSPRPLGQTYEPREERHRVYHAARARQQALYRTLYP